MTKDHGNMGRKSHLNQDVQKQQTLDHMTSQLPKNQPVRPYVSPDKATKSSKSNDKNPTK